MATTSKCALVVDDSKSARVVLRKMLEKHSLQVEAAASAEQAIDFLSRHSPDIIFMDHMMPGMDGFQAVQHIKENPATAMIPIVMYTSQNGEVYVGQARALGAVDVLAKDIQPTELQKVLKHLNLIETKPEDKSVAARARADAEPKKKSQVRIKLSESTVQRLARETSDLIQLPPSSGSIDSDKVGSLLEEQRLSLRQDILAATRNTQNNMGKQLESFDNRFQYLTDIVERDAQTPKTSVGIHLAWLLLLLLSVLTVWVFVGNHKANLEKESSDSGVQSDQLASALMEEKEQLERELLGLRSQINSSGNTSEWISALQWSVNLSSIYDYSEIPLDDRQLIKLRSLVDRLERIGFSGTINVNVHVGNFCLQRNAFDEFALSGDDTPIASCNRLEMPLEATIAIAEKQSINFANFVADVQSGARGDIGIQVIPHGNGSPLVGYPSRDEVKVAKKWNEVARQNNRIEYQIIAN